MNKNTRIEPFERDIDRRERMQLPAQWLDYRPVEERIQDLDEACLGLTLETARAEASRCIQCPSPQPCALACPLHNDIPTAMWEISKGNFFKGRCDLPRDQQLSRTVRAAVPRRILVRRLLRRGQVRPGYPVGPVGSFCSRSSTQNRGLANLQVLPPTGMRVAVSGSGPAGLTVAEELAKLGHKVTVFEMQRRQQEHSSGGPIGWRMPPVDFLRLPRRLCGQQWR